MLRLRATITISLLLFSSLSHSFDWSLVNDMDEKTERCIEDDVGSSLLSDVKLNGPSGGRQRMMPLARSYMECSGMNELTTDNPHNLYFVDAHSQWDHNVDEERIMSLMDHGGVYKTLLSVHMKRTWDSIKDFSKDEPTRIVPMIKTKGNQSFDYQSYLEEQSKSGIFKGVGEIHLRHDGDGGRFHDITRDFNDPKIKAVAELAIKNAWPFIPHIEFNALSDSERDDYMADLKAFLTKNPKLPVVLIHIGQLDEEYIRPLIENHSNIYFMLSHSMTKAKTNKAFIKLLADGKLKPKWRKLMLEHPKHFLFALDNVFSAWWTSRKYLREMAIWWRILNKFPAGDAHLIAHSNAERLWKLEKKPNTISFEPPWVTRNTLGEIEGWALSN